MCQFLSNHLRFFPSRTAFWKLPFSLPPSLCPPRQDPSLFKLSSTMKTQISIWPAMVKLQTNLDILRWAFAPFPRLGSEEERGSDTGRKLWT